MLSTSYCNNRNIYGRLNITVVIFLPCHSEDSSRVHCTVQCVAVCVVRGQLRPDLCVTDLDCTQSKSWIQTRTMVCSGSLCSLAFVVSPQITFLHLYQRDVFQIRSPFCLLVIGVISESVGYSQTFLKSSLARQRTWKDLVLHHFGFISTPESSCFDRESSHHFPPI